MKRWTSIPLSLCLTLVFGQSGLVAKGSSGQGDGSGRGQGAGSKYAQNSHSNGQGTLDRDSGKDRAMEVGRGKEKGLHKDQYSIGEGNDKDRFPKKDKDKVKKQHNDKKDKN